MEKTKSFLNIKSKLMAAVAMLLVAFFMVISSSYAWFTLSTAPEVTGIHTAVGANGNLEIALYTGSTITSGVGDSNLATLEKNKTWGNIVNLEDDGYGLQNIALYPSVLALDGTGKLLASGSVLGTPTYGNDGRIKSVNADGVSGIYNITTKNFDRNSTAKGVRAIGTVSSMSQQQLEWGDAVSKVSINLNSAKTTAEKSLTENGQGLIDIILGTLESTKTEYDIRIVNNMLTALAGTPASEGVAAVPGVADYLEEAMKYYLIAAAAYAEPNKSDMEFIAIKNAIISACDATTFPDLSQDTFTVGTTGVTVTIPADLKTVYNLYSGIKTDIAEAVEAYSEVQSPETASKDDAMTILAHLVVVDNVIVNGTPKSSISMSDTTAVGNLAGNIMKSGAVIVEIPKDSNNGKSGLFYNIAQLTNNMNASFNADVTAIGITIDDMPISIKTKAETDDQYILGGAKLPLPQPAPREGAVDEKLSDFYGYAIDLAFRTNAASSKLMLQTTPTNRIYSEGGVSETMGQGSTMTFTVTDTKFTVDNILNLMQHIRIVFTDTTTGDVVAAARLDTVNNVEKTGTTVTAYVKLCDYTLTTVDRDGAAGTGTETIQIIEFGDINATNDKGQMELTSLTQNEQKLISAYVYLDGTTVESKDVGTEDLSMTGTLNLQFSSDATLKAMDYADLKGQTTESTTSSSTPTTNPDDQGSTT